MARVLPIEKQFASSVLKRAGLKVTPRSILNMVGWMRAEGGHTHNSARFNFLNTTQPMPGAGNTGSQGNIKVYRDFNQGVDATVRTLRNGRYGGILANVNADPNTFARSVNASPWGTKTNFASIITGLGGVGAPSNVAPGAGPVPPAGTPGAADVQRVAGSLDAKRLMTILNNQRARSLQGIMPANGYQRELQKLVEQALPRAQVAAAGAGVGAGVATVASSLAGVAADASSKQAINAAKQYIGTPYSWGGGTPSGPTRGFGRGANTVGFDCSSLVQMAWAKAGVKLPRTTYEQIKVGQAIPTGTPAAWKPGDLLFPSTGHVQMYLGNGRVIEAPRTGGRVQIVPVRSKYIAVRRPG